MNAFHNCANMSGEGNCSKISKCIVAISVALLSAAWMKEGYDEFACRSHLEFFFMDRHEKLADNVFRSIYSNGESVIVNYGASAANVGGVEVPPLSAKLVPAIEH